MKSGDQLPLQTRRDFCVHGGQAVSLAALAALLPGCGGSPTSPSNSAPPLTIISPSAVAGGVAVTIGSGSPLASQGGAALVQGSGANLLLARTGQESFTALTAICTHEGCTVSGFENQTYVCPCHGSRYSTGGAVVTGPAVQSLRQFPTQFANDVVTISL